MKSLPLGVLQLFTCLLLIAAGQVARGEPYQMPAPGTCPEPPAPKKPPPCPRSGMCPPGVYTPVGAVMAGNDNGTIPKWDGGIKRAISGYRARSRHSDPFASDKPLCRITASNLAQNKVRLTLGAQAMFSKYTNFSMLVFPSRRSAAFPQQTYEMTEQNAKSANRNDVNSQLTGAAGGFPFPYPTSGEQVMWNHKLKYKGVAWERHNNQVTPTASGQYAMIRIREESLEYVNSVRYFFQQVESPARLAGNSILVQEPLNQDSSSRQAWSYNPWQRRVRKAQNIGYDNPGTASDGLITNDMHDMFSGALDRYDWKLMGKHEMYVPYNSYRAHAGNMNFDDLVKPGYLNPNYLRYELHRVWIVEAKLRAGQRHIIQKKTFYVDEDSWQILAADHYDNTGALWRYSEAHCINYYDQPLFWSTIEVHHDLKSGRYLASGLDNNEAVNNFSFETSLEKFTPKGLRDRQ